MSLPARPPAANSEAIIDDLSTTPLFMQNLPDTESDELAALRALQYEGTPLENALNFKMQGNELVATKQWADAREMYTKGLASLRPRTKDDMAVQDQDAARRDLRSSQGSSPESDAEIACLVNRALCQLRLGNFRATTIDCAAALTISPSNVKAWYRTTEALFASSRFDEAADACRRGLSVDPDNSPLQTLQGNIDVKRCQAAEIAQRRHRDEQAEQQKQLLLGTALKARGVKVRKSGRPPDMEDACIHLAPDPLSPESTLYFPVLLLYPMHAQSDFIKAFAETDSIGTHLDYIFPLPWDSSQQYTQHTIECFIETASGGLIKVGRSASLLKILTSSDVIITNEVFAINIVPVDSKTTWIEEMKRRKRP